MNGYSPQFHPDVGFVTECSLSRTSDWMTLPRRPPAGGAGVGLSSAAAEQTLGCAPPAGM